MTDEYTGRRHFLRMSSLAFATSLAGCSGDSTGGKSTTTTDTTTTARTTTSTIRTTTETNTATTTANLKGPKQEDNLPPDPDSNDGYPPSFETTPQKRSVNTSSFERTTSDGIEVPLVPLNIAYYWYARGEARFADARSKTAYDAAHIYGAVSSPAPTGQESDDPIASWPKSDRIICYCACPHTLSSMRAAQLLSSDYEEVYAIDEGFTPWRKQNYPVNGTDIEQLPAVKTVYGRTNSESAGNTAWAIETDSEQMEATTIGSDGRYTLHLKFINVDSNTKIRVKTPDYTIQKPLGLLTSGRITASGNVINSG